MNTPKELACVLSCSVRERTLEGAPTCCGSGLSLPLIYLLEILGKLLWSLSDSHQYKKDVELDDPQSGCECLEPCSKQFFQGRESWKKGDVAAHAAYSAAGTANICVGKKRVTLIFTLKTPALFSSTEWVLCIVVQKRNGIMLIDQSFP